MRNLMILMALLALLGAAAVYSAKNLTGEIATLYTTDRDGRSFQTQLWILDDRHEVWIRASRPTSQWLDRLIQHPEIQLDRGGDLKTYRATPLAHRRERINALIADRYGWAEWILAKFEDREYSVPILLDPFV
jgi:hypothetical protein